MLVASPETLDQYRLDLRYLQTETEGPSFESMKARLDAVASQCGMSDIFKLRGVDVFEVLSCRPAAADGRAEAARTADHLPELDSFTQRLSDCDDLDSLLSVALEGLSSLFSCAHSFVMFPDEGGTHLYTGASYGFEPSGVGSEVLIGEGILGVAAARRAAVRTTNMTREMLLTRAVRLAIERHGNQALLAKEIPLPGLAYAQSQLVRLLWLARDYRACLCLQDPSPGKFMASDERALQVAARHLAVAISNFRSTVPHLPRLRCGIRKFGRSEILS